MTSAGVDDYRHSIQVNGETIAVISRKGNGVNATRYLLHDYLGSVAKIGWDFSAFGLRRNPMI